jgi:serine/threonine-protein kinase
MDAANLVGRRLSTFRVDARLGRGSSGTVYRAFDLGRDRTVALKVLHPEAAARVDDRAGFEREARWLARCDDPHIVPIYATGCARGVHFIAMELMAGTLQDRLAGGRPDCRTLVGVGLEILLGLAAAHRAGIIHRDIKPANVGLATSGMIKLLDFGIANPLPWSTHVDEADTARHLACVGSLHYMSPEQLRGDTLNERTDIYSTGAVLYELATGLRPFPEVRLACLIDAILNRDPVPPSRLARGLGGGIDAVLLRALAKRPALRFPSAFAMMDALLGVCGLGRETADKPEPPAVSSVSFLPSSDDATRTERRRRPATGPRIHSLAAGAGAGRRRGGDESSA